MSVLGKMTYKMCNIYGVQLPMTISCILTITHGRCIFISFFNNTAWKCSIRTVLPFFTILFLNYSLNVFLQG